MIPRRVAFVVGTTSGGTGRHVRMLAAGLAARGVQVAVYGPAEAERRFRFTQAGVAFHPVEIAGRPRPASDLRAVVRLRRALAAPSGPAAPITEAPSVVHAHGLRAGALAALALRPLRRSGGPALMVTLHNAPPAAGLAGAIYAVLERVVARRADRLLCVSADLEQRARRRGARSCGRAVVPAPAADDPAADGPAADGPAVADADASSAAPPPGRPSARAELGAADRPLVLAAGRLAPQKGFGTLLDAAARWRDRRPEPLVLIAGDGPLAGQLAARITAERLPVRLLGHRCDLPSLMAAADVLVLPSIWEGQPLFAQEALRAGTPLVATRVGGVPDLTGEEAALLVPPSDPDRLAAAILSVLGDADLAQRLRVAAQLRARSLPSDQDAIDAVLSEYGHLD